LGPPSTNHPRELPGITAYYGTNLGVTMGCGTEKHADGKQYTGFFILNYGAANVGAGSMTPEEYARVMTQEVQKANEWFAALSAAQPSAPLVVEFLRLFPHAEVRFRYFTSTGEPGFDVEVDLHERYELGMQLPVRFDSEGLEVIGYGEPKFHLWEATNVVKRQTSRDPAGGRTFGSAEWRTLVAHGGDFSAIGYIMRTNQPIAGFRDRKSQP